MLKKWQIKEKRIVNDHKIFKVSHHLAHHEKKAMDFTFTVLNSNDWVNVIPLTKEGKFVIIKQYRAGIEDFCLEFPGGIIDAGESPEEAGPRELTEETGYTASAHHYISFCRPNPAIMDNKCHFLLATGCKPCGKTNFDPAEEIETLEVSQEQLIELIKNNEFNNALMLAALQQASLLFPNEIKI